MRRMKNVLAMVLTAALVAGVFPTAAVLADGTGEKVLTLGSDLSGEQKSTMLKYFGVEGENIRTLTVTNADEREFLSDFVPLEEIGTKTYSCALVRPTTAGGIQVKTANLTWVTSNMIASTLSTCGVTNCQVLAASPFSVSGTGALTGIIMAYESASGRKLDRKKVRAGTRELIAMARIGDRIGPPRATLLVNRAKVDVIEHNVTTVNEITEIVNNISVEYNISLDEDELDLLVELLEDIADLDYEEEDLADMQETLDHVEENVIEEIQEEEAEDDILAGTDDAALGEDAVFDSTEDTIRTLQITPETEEEPAEPETEDETEEDSGLMVISGEFPEEETEEETGEEYAAPASSNELFDSLFGTGDEGNDADSSSAAAAPAEETEKEPTEAAAPASSDDLFDSIFEDEDSYDDSGTAAEEPAAQDDFFDDMGDDDWTTFDTFDEYADDEESSADAMDADAYNADVMSDSTESGADEGFTISDLSVSPKGKAVDPDLSALEIRCSDGTLTNGSGSLTVYDENDTKIERVSMSDSSKVEVYSDEVDVYLDTPLSENTSYYVILSDDALELDGVSLKASSESDWKFTTSSEAGDTGEEDLGDEDDFAADGLAEGFSGEGFFWE